MIGVLCRQEEQEFVKEFFELFKTPWEFFSEGSDYRTVISTVSGDLKGEASLAVIYSSDGTQFDIQEGITVDSTAPDQLAIDTDGVLPIYGKLASLRGAGRPLLRSRSGAHVFGLGFSESHGVTLRVGYDLFREVALLLSDGQPIENAPIPTLELHISLLREWIVNAGIPLVEIPPVPWGHEFIACLTHDVDFGGIRRHNLDHTMWGFVYRAVVGSSLALIAGKGSLVRLIKNWTAVLSLPLVYLGLVKDFWDDFDRYTEIEGGLRSTFFLVPFKNTAGDKVQGEFPARRAARYDIDDVREQANNLVMHGCEIGLHGIDAWHNVDSGIKEKNRIMEVTGKKEVGVRIHWLCFDRHSPAILDQAGFDYDSTVGYNETVGYRAGTTQVFRPLGATRLLELPLHIQDTALFYPRRLASTNAQAQELCAGVLNAAERFGGVVTVLWHERSLAPERLWGEFYIQLLQDLRERRAWFGTAEQVVQWFRQRRAITFDDCHLDAHMLRLQLKCDGTNLEAPFIIRVHRLGDPISPGACQQHVHFDVLWDGKPSIEIPLS